VTLSLILTNTYFVGTPDDATVTIQNNTDDLPAPGTQTAGRDMSQGGEELHRLVRDVLASLNEPWPDKVKLYSQCKDLVMGRMN